MQHSTSVHGTHWRLAAFLCLAYLSATAQTIENVRTSFDQSKQLMFINYDLKGLNYKKEIKITPYIVSGDASLPPVKSLIGDFGWVTRGGKNKVMIWDPLKDGLKSLEGIKIELKTEARDAAIPRLRGVALQGSNSAPFGVKCMQLSRIGFFAGFRVGRLPPGYRYTISDAGEMDYLESGVYEIGTEKRLASYAITAGPIFQMSRNIYAYTGMGYGIEQRFWKYQSYNLVKSPVSSDWALSENTNRKGIAADAGIVIRVGRRVLMDVGGSSIQFKSFQITGGIGLLLTNNQKN